MPMESGKQLLERAEVVLYYERYRPGVFRYCKVFLRDADLAKDAMQDVFLKMARAGRSFGEVHDKEAWLFQVARRCCVDVFRRGKARASLANGLRESLVAAPPPPREAPLFEARDHVRHLWSHPDLDDVDRRLLELLCTEEATQEIALTLGMSPQAVNQRKRSLARLMLTLDEPQEKES